ncbi:hypothetical protein QQG55_40875 [Brugia pahangi]
MQTLYTTASLQFLPVSITYGSISDACCFVTCHSAHHLSSLLNYDTRTQSCHTRQDVAVRIQHIQMCCCMSHFAIKLHVPVNRAKSNECTNYRIHRDVSIKLLKMCGFHL